MRLVGLTIWYDEAPKNLAAMVTSMAPHIDHLVAVDGAFELYPGARPWSPVEQQEALLYTAGAAGLGFTLHAPREPWEGNEVAKRSFMFRLGEQVATPNEDWYWVMDADQVVADWPYDTKARLEQTELDVAEVTFIERHPEAYNTDGYARTRTWEPEGTFPVRNMFRAVPGLKVIHNHYTYVAGHNRLWGNESNGEPIAEALDLTDLRIEHRTHHRTKHRHDAQYAYYRLRDSAGAECGTCAICGIEANVTATRDWEVVSTDGRWTLAADWAWACPAHKHHLDARAERQIRRLTNGLHGLKDMTVTKGKVPKA